MLFGPSTSASRLREDVASVFPLFVRLNSAFQKMGSGALRRPEIVEDNYPGSVAIAPKKVL